MIATENIVVKRAERRKCRWPKPHECVDGKCVRSGYNCVSGGGRTCSRWRTYLCPDGYCTINDSTCMRPCGTRNRIDRYNQPCPGINATMCARHSSYCPEVCTRYRCPDGRCRSNQLFCEPCTGYRCRSGVCLPAEYRCNGLEECTNGEDELVCINNDTGVSGPKGRFSTGAVGPASGFLFLMLMVLGICCRVSRRRQYYHHDRNDTRALRRFMATIHTLSETGHLRHLRNLSAVPPVSPPSTPTPRMEEPAPPYTEIGSPMENVGAPSVPPYIEVEAPPTYEEAIASLPQPDVPPGNADTNTDNFNPHHTHDNVNPHNPGNHGDSSREITTNSTCLSDNTETTSTHQTTDGDTITVTGPRSTAV